jgi:hypothetical protein
MLNSEKFDTKVGMNILVSLNIVFDDNVEFSSIK